MIIVANKKINTSWYMAIFVVIVLSACSQSSSLSDADKTKIINEKIQSVENSLINDASIIELTAKYVKSSETPDSIYPSHYEPDDEIFLIVPKVALTILQLELAKTVFTQVKRVEGYEDLIYFSTEYFLDNSNEIIAKSAVVACENKIDICSKIHEEMIEKGITSIFKNFGDNWTIVGYYGDWL